MVVYEQMIVPHEYCARWLWPIFVLYLDTDDDHQIVLAVA